MKKVLKIVIIAIAGLLGASLVIVVIIGIFFVNREDRMFKSTNGYVDGNSLKQDIKKLNRSAIVIITSPGCPGVPEFMPKIENQQEVLNSRNIDVYNVIDMLNGKDMDSILLEFKRKYNIQYDPLIIDPSKHPSGNLFNASRKYDTFLTELCGSCNDGSLGYPFYIYYNKGEYIGKSYYLNDSILSSLN